MELATRGAAPDVALQGMVILKHGPLNRAN